MLLAAGISMAGMAAVPGIRIGILGNPDHQVPWTDQALEKLKAIGFNEVQINIAWGFRPFGEPLNLADVVTVPGETELPGAARWREELKQRVVLARRHGMRTLFHFGSPRADYDPYTGIDAAGAVPSGTYHIDDVTSESWYDIVDPKVRDHELALLREFRRQFPEVDDILVYSYDQHAWEAPEFQYTKFSYGIPLTDRLAGYLGALHKAWTEGRAGKVRMWWEPWELSAGQVYTILPKLPRSDFGLIVHSNIAEAQLALPVDVWLRNTARMCRDLGMPVIAESFFSSASEELEPLAIPAPRLVDEEYLAFVRTPGIVGIKEYFGINTDVPDFDLDLLRARLQDSSHTTAQLIAEITERFGVLKEDVRTYLDLLANALQTYPWDASWLAREVGTASADHGWAAATIQGATFATPAWQSTRHARFMKTDGTQPHFWMLEDVELRCKLTADLLDSASATYRRMMAAPSNPDLERYLKRTQQDVDTFRRVSRSYALHLRETNVAQMLRQDLTAGRPLDARLTKELDQLLDSDAANQGEQGRVVEMRRQYRNDPAAFIRRYLAPPEGKSTEQAQPEKGNFTLTTR